MAASGHLTPKWPSRSTRAGAIEQILCESCAVGTRQRILTLAFAVSVLGIGGCSGKGSVDEPGQTPVGVDASDSQIEGVAQQYLEHNTHSAHAKVIGIRRGDECTAVSLRTTDGKTAGVALVLQGHPPPTWQAVGMSSTYTLRAFVDSGDSLCDLANILDTAHRRGVAPPLTFGVNWSLAHG
jgi:hypothetical protein